MTESTTEAFNILLPLLGAIVTDSGGLLSHSAIVAREYGIPGVVGHARGDRADRRRRARARRRRRRRGDGPRVTRRRPARRGARRPRSSARRRSGSGEAIRDGLPVPPGVALSGPIVEAVAGGRRGRDRAASTTAVRPLGGAARGALVGGRRGRRRRELRRAAPHAAQRPVRRTTLTRGAPRDLVVGELRLRDHLPPAGRPLHPPERRRRRPVAPRSRDAPGVMFTQNPITGADERMIEASWGLGEAVVAGLRDPGQLPARPRRARCSSARRGCKRIAIRSAPDGRHGRGERSRRSSQERLCLDDEQLAELNELADAVRGGLRPGPRHRVGDRRTGRSTCCSAGPSRGRAREPADVATGAPSRARADRRVVDRVPLFAGLDRRARSQQIARLFKERHFPAGETVVKEGVGRAPPSS